MNIFITDQSFDYVSSTTPWHGAMLRKMHCISPQEYAVIVLLVPSESESFDSHQRDNDIFSYMERMEMFPNLRIINATRDGDRLASLLQEVPPDKIHWFCRDGWCSSPSTPLQLPLHFPLQLKLEEPPGPPSIFVYVARDDLHTLDKVFLSLLKLKDFNPVAFRVIFYYPHCRAVKLQVPVEEKDRASIMRGNEVTLSYHNARVSLRVKEDLEPHINEVVADFTLVRPGCNAKIIEHIVTVLRGGAIKEVELITTAMSDSDMLLHRIARSHVFLPVGFECVPELAIAAQQLGSYCIFLEDTEEARKACLYGEVLRGSPDLYFDETIEKVRRVIPVADVVRALQHVIGGGGRSLNLNDPFVSYGKEIARILFR